MNKLTRAEVAQILGSQMRQCEAERMLAFLAIAEGIVINSQQHIRRDNRRLPRRAVRQLAAMQNKQSPRGFNKLIGRIFDAGGEPKDGLYKALARLHFAEHLAFQLTDAYERAFAAEKERVAAEIEPPP